MYKTTYLKCKQEVFNLFGGFIFLIISSSVFADENIEPLISVVISRSGTVSYINLAPLYYETKRKGMSSIQMPPGISPHQKQGELNPMQLIIYSTCDREDPQKGSVLGLRPQFLHSSLLLSPHPDDRPAAYYLLPTGLFRMLKAAIRGSSYYFEEEGVIKVSHSQNTDWPVNITRSDVTATNSKTDYSIEFSIVTDQPLFIQDLISSANPIGKNKIPQVTILLESPSLYVKATYALVHKGTRTYQPIKSISIIDWWEKQQRWCPRKE